MRLLRLNIPGLRVVRTLALICVCALMFFASTVPAYAAVNRSVNQSQPTHPSEGEVKMDNLQRESEKFMNPEHSFSQEEVQRKSIEGLNETQGAADLDLMKRPSNSDATSIEQGVEKALETLQGKD